MDFISLTSDRSGLLKKIGQRFLTHLDPVSHTPATTSTSGGDGSYTLPSPGDHHQELVQQLHQALVQLQQVEQHLVEPVFPLSHTPEDVRPNILSFLPARELSSIRRVSRGFLQTADLHAETLWGRLCRHDFPSLAPPPSTGAGGRERGLFSPHQQYVKNVMHRAIDEAGNLRANRRLRESLDNFTWPIVWPAERSNTTIYSAISTALGNHINNGRSDGGVIGLLSDLVTVPDLRIARALSHKRRAALSTVIVDSDNVVFDFRRRGIHTGPVNFLPLSTLRLENPTPLAPLLTPQLPPPSAGNPAAAAAVAVAAKVAAGGTNGRRWEDDDGARLLPLSPETPTPAGFLGYAVRLLELRPAHEPLRWTVLFTVFKDLVVFETTEQAEAVRARVPDRRLFYCALDHPGAQDDPCPSQGRSLPHISHWGFQRVLFGNADGGRCGGSGGDGVAGARAAGAAGSAGETVGDAVQRQMLIACFARSSLAFLQYSGSDGFGRSVAAQCRRP